MVEGRADVGLRPFLDRVAPRQHGQWRKARNVDNLFHCVIFLAVAATGWLGGSSSGGYAAFTFT